MTPLERLRAAVNFEDYDRPPFADNEWVEVLARLVPHYSGCPPRQDLKYSEADRAATVRATCDMVPWAQLYAHSYGRYPMLGEIPKMREGGRDESDSGFSWVIHAGTQWIENRPFDDVPGAIAHLERMIEAERGAQPSLPPDFADRLGYARRMLGETVISFPYLSAGLDGMYPLFGWTLFAPMTKQCPDLIAEYLNALAEQIVQRVSLYARHITAEDCPVVLIAADFAHNGGLLLSPDFLCETMIPGLTAIVAACHAVGLKAVYHSEGDIHKMIDALIDAGVDGINTLSPLEGMDPVAVREQYPDLILWGGMENAVLLVTGTPQEVRAEVRRVVDGVGRGLILSASGGVHPACKPENCIAMIEALHGEQRVCGGE